MKKINPKAVIMESKTSVFIFLYPIMILLSMIIYMADKKSFSNFVLFLFISLICFIAPFLNFHKKSIILTKKSIYLFLRDKEIFKLSLESDFAFVDVKQDRMGKLLNYGTLVLSDSNNNIYEYFFLSNPQKFKEKIINLHLKIMREIDPNFVSPYNLEETKEEIKVDSIED